MLKKSLTNIILILFLMISLLPIVISGKSFSNRIVNVDNGVSFNVNLTSPSFWYAIKMKSNDWVNVTIDCKYYLSTSNDTIKKRGFFILFCLVNEDNTAGYRTGFFGTGPSSEDKYFQINIGILNWSYYHFEDPPRFDSRVNGTARMSLSNQTWYFIFAGYIVEGYYDFWFNTSENVEISTTQGIETFFYQREDFYGNLNVGWGKGTVIINGVKKIKVNNLLFGYYASSPGTGFSYVEFEDPVGISKWGFHIYIRNRLILEKTYDGKPWDGSIQIGINGEWIFKTHMTGYERAASPNVALWGADVKLPE